MDAILDVTESMVMEAMNKEEREKFIDNLYRPDVAEKPKNFEPDDQLDAFAAFEQIAGNLK